MRHPPALLLIVLLVAATAALVGVPVHIEADHHGEEAAEHEGEHHTDADHEIVAPLKPVSPPPDVRPVEVAGFGEGAGDAPALVGHAPRRQGLAATPIAPDEAATPPAPPRAPPTLRA